MEKTNELKEIKRKRGAPFKGDKPRHRYNFTLNPDAVEAGKFLAKTKDCSLSEIVEKGILLQVGK
jgi:hypothetical protein